MNKKWRPTMTNKAFWKNYYSVSMLAKMEFVLFYVNKTN